jgi:kynurenine formamidase
MAVPDLLSPADFDALYETLKRRAHWGREDRRGALNHITPYRVVEAAIEIRSGRTVSMAAPIETEVSADNPTPSRHEMTGATDDTVAATGLDFAFDRLALDIHGNADSHIDALCHVSYNARLYNDVPANTLTSEGAGELSIETAASQGIVGRGVLLDIPRLHEVAWLEPGDHVTADDLARAERAEGLHVRAGDLLFVRVGHRHRRNQLGAWDAAQRRAGLHPGALEFVAERNVSVLGSDGNNDTAPPATTNVAFPVHVLAINALGLHLMDYLQFGELRSACEAERRWSFFCVIGPLRLPVATGSPVNPIAIF